MQRSAFRLTSPVTIRCREARGAAPRHARPPRQPGIGRALRRGITRCVLALLVLGLAALASYDLAVSKPRTPNLPVERLCPQRFSLTSDGVLVQVPLCLSVESLDVADASIQRAVIVMQGNSRNAPVTYAAVESAVQAAGRSDVLIAAPQFLTALDLGAHDPPPDVVRWRSSGWSQGDRSEALSATVRPSSFEVVDALVEAIVAPGRYPSLRGITIAGHSAGGQFVQRYAAGTRLEQQPTALTRGIAVHYLVANPSSYLYLFPREPDRLTQRCPRFDTYKFGLTGLNAYFRGLEPDAIRAAYAQRPVTLLLGRMDHQVIDPSKDDSCAAEAQGAHRLNRGIRYAQHLDRAYGVGNHQTRLVVVPGVGHNARGIFMSPEGRAALLDP